MDGPSNENDEQDRRAGGSTGSPVRRVGAIDIGGTRTKWSVVDAEQLCLLAPPKEVPTVRSGDDREMVASFVEAGELFASMEVDLVGVVSPGPFTHGEVGTGVGLPFADVDRVVGQGVRLAAGSLPIADAYDHGYPLQQRLHALFEAPVVMAKDAIGNAWAERVLGAARQWSSFALLINGTGIGFAAMTNDQVVADDQDRGPEVWREVPPGSNGRTVEQMTAGPAVMERFGAIESATPVEVREGTAAHCARWQAPVVGPLMDELGVERLVLSGGVTDVLGDTYARAMHEALDAYGVSEVSVSPLRRSVGILGAAIVALRCDGFDLGRLLRAASETTGS